MGAITQGDGGLDDVVFLGQEQWKPLLGNKHRLTIGSHFMAHRHFSDDRLTRPLGDGGCRCAHSPGHFDVAASECLLRIPAQGPSSKSLLRIPSQNPFSGSTFRIPPQDIPSESHLRITSLDLSSSLSSGSPIRIPFSGSLHPQNPSSEFSPQDPSSSYLLRIPPQKPPLGTHIRIPPQNPLSGSLLQSFHSIPPQDSSSGSPQRIPPQYPSSGSPFSIPSHDFPSGSSPMISPQDPSSDASSEALLRMSAMSSCLYPASSLLGLA